MVSVERTATTANGSTASNTRGGRGKVQGLLSGHPPPTHSEVFFSAGISG